MKLKGIISNALKHAFADKKEGVKKVHLKKTSNKDYEMVVGNNGIGSASTEQKTGLSSKLIQIFTKQLEGVITELNTTGTVYKIVFPQLLST